MPLRRNDPALRKRKAGNALLTWGMRNRCETTFFMHDYSETSHSSFYRVNNDRVNNPAHHGEKARLGQRNREQNYVLSLS